MITIPVRSLFSFQLAVNVNCKRIITLARLWKTSVLKAHYSSISQKATSDKWDGWPSLLLLK